MIYKNWHEMEEPQITVVTKFNKIAVGGERVTDENGQ
jgi:hypothetical protein